MRASLTVRRGRTVALIAVVATAGLATGPGPADAAGKRPPPKPVPAWYMTAASTTDLIRQAKESACTFAKRQSKGSRLMLFDFGAARKFADGTFGASLRKVRRFRNGAILEALEGAARSYHRCHRRGSAIIAYGNTNAMPGYMGKADAHEAGLRHAATVRQLRKFQRREHHYRHQGAAGAGDIEPGFGYPGVSKALVSGSNTTTYYDFGNAGGCPGQPGAQGCHNGWDVEDLGEVSMSGHSLPLPEIYHPYEAVQWARIQRRWEGRYFFAGVTGAPIEELSPRQGWRLLRRRADRVKRELVNIRNAGSTQSVSKAGRSSARTLPGAPMTAATPARLVADPEGFFSTSLIYPLENEWVVADHRRFVAVDAGSDPLDPSTGVLGVFRQNYLRLSQTQRVIEVPDTGALELTGAPVGARAALSQPAPSLRFTSATGVTGTLDLERSTVTLDTAPGISP